MKDMLYAWLDLAEYAALGALLAYLMDQAAPGRFSFRGSGKGETSDPVRRKSITFWLACMQYAAVRQALSQCDFIKSLFYGEGMHLASSRQSILPVAASFSVTLLVFWALYRGSRMRVLSLVAAFYAFTELSRFILYPLVVGSMSLVAGHFGNLFFERGAISQEEYFRRISVAEAAWNLASAACLVCLVFLCVSRYKKEIPSCGDGARPQAAAVLFVPELMGLLYAAMLRCILFYYKQEAYLIIDEYPELNFIIPILSLLCLASILLSARLTGQAEREHERRVRETLMREEAQELAAYAGDMEDVYRQIRGMRHDMRHYIADVGALLAQAASDGSPALCEVRRYVGSMQARLEGLELSCRTGNSVTDVILGRYARLAEQDDIAFSYEFRYPDDLAVDAFDLGIILNNGLENAMEACRAQEGAYVSLSARRTERMFWIVIENSFAGTLSWGGEFPVSNKAGEGHGHGLANIADCAEKYFGRAACRVKDRTFVLTVMLQGR